MHEIFIGSFQKRSILPPRRKFLPSGEGGEEKLLLIIVNVLGHPKGVGGLTSYFLRGGGMDVFWNDPFPDCIIICYNHNHIIKLVTFFRRGVLGAWGAVAPATFPAIYSPVDVYCICLTLKSYLLFYLL